MSLNLVLKGVDETMKAFDKLEKEFEKATMQAVRAGAAIVRREARKRINNDTGNLRRSISVKVLKPKSPNKAAAIVGPSKVLGRSEGKRTIKADGYYGIWVEEGHRKASPKKRLTRARKTPLSDKHKGKAWRNQYGSGIIDEAVATEFGTAKTKPAPFLRPAIDENESIVAAKMAEVYRDALNGRLQNTKAFDELVGMLEDSILEGIGGGSGGSGDFND